MSQKFSLVVPTYTANYELESFALSACKSYRPYVDELIVVEDGMMYSEKLRNAADVYIYCKDNVGFSANVNRGWRYATGDFVGIASSDTHLVEGNLRDLCVKGRVTSPIVDNQEIHALAGSFWVAPKAITKKYGYLREEMKTYYSDTEYDERVRDVFQKVGSVKRWHHQARSVKASGVEGKMDADKEAYENLPQC